MNEKTLARTCARAILGIDTLWGGDVLNPSGTGRFIADSWFADQDLPRAYTDPTAAPLRASGGVSAARIDLAAVDAYLEAIDVQGAIRSLVAAGGEMGGLRGAYLTGTGQCLLIMWDLVQELLGRGEKVPYERCVIGSTGRPPEPSRPPAKREALAALLAKQGFSVAKPGDLLAAVDTWRLARLVPKESIPQLADAFIAQLEAGTLKHLVPHLPKPLQGIHRANIRCLPIEDAWFSGSMNYIGRARDHKGKPQYEATYELNAALQISVPEFLQLVSHEVVPGHVTNSALIQALYVQGKLGFESTVLTMNTRGAALFEGIANNAILIAFGVTEIEDLPDDDLKIGVLLALLQDDAKNQSSWLTWQEDRPQAEVAAVLRQDYLCSEERADKLSGAWGRHPLLGRMYLPAYRAGTEKVAELRRQHPPEVILPALYNVSGLVDLVTIDRVLAKKSAKKAKR